MSLSILISVPPYFEMRTLSPFLTVKSTFFPLSSILPVPRATTLPSCGFSFAVSGIMIPPFFTSCSSIGCTSTRSPSGFTLTAAIGFISSFWFFGCADDHFSQTAADKLFSSISSCLRRRLRTPHRQRRRHRRVFLRLLRHPDAPPLRVQVADRLARLPLTPACKARR